MYAALYAEEWLFGSTEQPLSHSDEGAADDRPKQPTASHLRIWPGRKEPSFWLESNVLLQRVCVDRKIKLGRRHEFIPSVKRRRELLSCLSRNTV